MEYVNGRSAMTGDYCAGSTAAIGSIDFPERVHVEHENSAQHYVVPAAPAALVLRLRANGAMSQSQILIAEMNDADGVQICVKRGWSMVWTGEADFHSINSRYFQT
jgi:hypothetical protein